MELKNSQFRTWSYTPILPRHAPKKSNGSLALTPPPLFVKMTLEKWITPSYKSEKRTDLP